MSLEPGRRHYAAVFFLSLSLLMLEIALARILTVALLSHYAFVAISLAMFGLGLGALAIYLFPARFPADRVDAQLSALASLFGVTSALSLLAFLHLRVVQDLSMAGLVSLVAAYGVLAFPFFLGGLCIALVMTHFSARIARIYFADLAGAGLGCLGVVLALEHLAAPQVVLVVALVVCATASMVARQAGRRSLRIHGSTLLAATLLVAGLSTDLFRMRHVKEHSRFYSETELWNAFSRISAFDAGRNAAQIVPLPEWEGYAGDQWPATRMLDIDGSAWTPMMQWDGSDERIAFLRDSVLYTAHSIRPGARVLVIGTGGGRDLLAALAWGQTSIHGIEINPLMREMVEEHYGDFSGRPYSHPAVDVVIDEARSRLASSAAERYDLIQLSLIDTFSLNAAGGVVFSENYLYTTEAFGEYFARLADDGVLTLTRYFVSSYPLEILRLVAMARDAWEREGAQDFPRCVFVALQGINATMVVGKRALTDAEVAALSAEAARIQARVLYAPGMEGGHEDVAAVAASADWRSFVAAYPYAIDPPTDDRPFFFSFLRSLRQKPELDPLLFLKMWRDALVLMAMLNAVVAALAALFFLVPLALFARRGAGDLPVARAAPLLLYFACLGYGFLLLEIPLLQRFVLFLGYPVYALAVVLFSLLLFSGIGSLASERLVPRARQRLPFVLAAIVALSLAWLHVVPATIAWLIGEAIAVRIAATVALLAPLGILLGMAYPLGIAVLREHGEELVPWAWGMNGAMSVVASVAAVFLGSRIGFTSAFLTGVAAYALALVLMLLATRGGGSTTAFRRVLGAGSSRPS